MRFPRAALVESYTIEGDITPLLNDLMYRGYSGYLRISGRHPGELYVVVVRGRPEIAIYSDGQRDLFGRRAVSAMPLDGSVCEVYAYERADLIVNLFPEARIRAEDLRQAPGEVAPLQSYRPSYTTEARYPPQPYGSPVKQSREQEMYQPPQPQARQQYREPPEYRQTVRGDTAGVTTTDAEVELKKKIAEKAIREAEIRRLEEELKAKIMQEIRAEMDSRAPTQQQAPGTVSTYPSAEAVRQAGVSSEEPAPRGQTRGGTAAQSGGAQRAIPEDRVEPLNNELAELERKIEERKAMLESMKIETAPAREELAPTRTGEVKEEKAEAPAPAITLNPEEVIKKDEEFRKRSEDIKKRIEEELMRKRQMLTGGGQATREEEAPAEEPAPRASAQVEKREEEAEVERKPARRSRSARSYRPEAEGGGLFEQLIEMNKALRKSEDE